MTSRPFNSILKNDFGREFEFQDTILRYDGAQGQVDGDLRLFEDLSPCLLLDIEHPWSSREQLGLDHEIESLQLNYVPEVGRLG